MERLQAFWRARIVDCKLSVISDPDDWPNRKSEIIERWRRGSERREGNPWHQVNTAVAMKIIPCASTLPTLQTPRKARIISYLSRFPFWHFMSIWQPAEPAHSFSPPGSGGRGPPKTGIGDRRQDQSFKILLYRAGSGVFSHPCADK